MNTERAMDQQMEDELEQESPCFPVEIWCAIFQYLNPNQLLRARLVCRHWYRIIGSSSALMNKVQLEVEDETNFEACLSSMNETRFKRVAIDFRIMNLKNMSGWTAGALSSLTTLTITSNFDYEDLLDILKETPNLRSFHYNGWVIGNIPEEIDFKLHFLEELKVEFTRVSDRFFETFSKICTRLEILYVDLEFFEHDGQEIEFDKDVIKLIQTSRNTLECIEGDYGDDFWIEVADIEGLRLKRIWDWNEPPIFQIIRKQSAIEVLSIGGRIPDEVFFEIGSSLPQLKSIRVSLDEFHEPSMFSYFCLPQLKHLSLHAFPPYYLILGISFPNLCSVELIEATINSWPELFNTLAGLKNLNFLTLDTIQAFETSDEGFKNMENLKYLKLSECKIPKTVFSLLITQSPDLRVVCLNKMELDDDDILPVCSKLRQLRTLSFYFCDCLTQKTVDHIIKYCQFLQTVNFYWCKNLSTQDTVHRINSERKDIHVTNG